MTKKKEQTGPVLCIDGYNIRSGGGLSHLTEILNEYVKLPEYFSRIVIFSSRMGPLKMFVKTGWRVTIKAAIPTGIPIEIE